MVNQNIKRNITAKIRTSQQARLFDDKSFKNTPLPLDTNNMTSASFTILQLDAYKHLQSQMKVKNGFMCGNAGFSQQQIPFVKYSLVVC